MQQRGAVANSAKGAWGENSAPFVFRTPLLGSPPSTVCPSPVKRSFRESISRRTVMLAQWQFISQQTPLVNQHLTINAGSRANVTDLSSTTTYVQYFRCTCFQIRVQSGWKGPEGCSVKKGAAWSPGHIKTNKQKRKNNKKSTTTHLVVPSSSLLIKSN